LIGTSNMLSVWDDIEVVLGAIDRAVVTKGRGDKGPVGRVSARLPSLVAAWLYPRVGGGSAAVEGRV